MCNAVRVLVAAAMFFSAIHAGALEPVSGPWLRLPHELGHPRLNRTGEQLAYTDQQSGHLYIIDLASKKIQEVSREAVGPSFFWTPNGFRVFFAYSQLNASRQAETVVSSYDRVRQLTQQVAVFPSLAGFLTLDPRDLKFYLLGGATIHTRRIVYPEQRMARWQIATRDQFGSWVVGQTSVVWVNNGGYSMEPMRDDGSGIESFDISPDGRTIAWATKRGSVYISDRGKQPQNIGRGRDPSWHPIHDLLLFAGGRTVGDVIRDTDLAIYDPRFGVRFLQTTQFSAERWPIVLSDGKTILFTKQRSTDLYSLKGVL